MIAQNKTQMNRHWNCALVFSYIENDILRLLTRLCENLDYQSKAFVHLYCSFSRRKEKHISNPMKNSEKKRNSYGFTLRILIHFHSQRHLFCSSSCLSVWFCFWLSQFSDLTQIKKKTVCNFSELITIARMIKIEKMLLFWVFVNEFNGE